MRAYLKTFGDDPKDVELKVGEEITLGRGSLPDCSDKKVSRSHASLKVNKNGVAVLTSLHINPCFYFEKDPASNPKIVKKDTTQVLKSGEVFGFQAQQYKYTIYLEGFENNGKETSNDADVNGASDNKPVDDEDTKDTIENYNGSDEPKKRGRKPGGTKKNNTSQDSDDYKEDEDDEDEDEDEPEEEADSDDEEVSKPRSRRGRASNTVSQKGRPRRAPKAAPAKSSISLEDFAASDDELWSSEDEKKAKGRLRKQDVESDASDSDWEADNKKGATRGGRKKNYAESDNSSDSDWGKKKKKATPKKAPAKRGRPTRGASRPRKSPRKKNRSESEEEDDFVDSESEEEVMPTKRARGTRAKRNESESEEESEQESPKKKAKQPAAKGRGRPKRQVATKKVKLAESEEEEEEENSENGDATPVKKEGNGEAAKEEKVAAAESD